MGQKTVQKLTMLLRAAILKGYAWSTVFVFMSQDPANAACPPWICPAPAPPPGPSTGNNWSTIPENTTTSVSLVPGLITGVSYLLALMFGFKAILKIKNHVENPISTPIREGTISLLAGGALLALPMVYEAMFNTVGAGGANATAATLNRVAFSVN